MNFSRGRNYKKNKAKRERAKQIRGSACWRASSSGGALASGVGSSESGDFRSGFSLLSEQTRRELQQSRAERLIEENKRAVEVTRSKRDEMSGHAGMVAAAVRIARLVSEGKKLAGDSWISGWVESLASSVQESMAADSSRKDPSIPTVEELKTTVMAGVEKSAEKIVGSDFGLGGAMALRKHDYDLLAADIREAYLDMPYHTSDELDHALEMLQEKYADLFVDGTGYVPVRVKFD